jgi:cathepsin A (carboxypeptidase C)
MESPSVALAFNAAGDLAKGATEYVAALLERDVRVLIFAGSYDWIGNWIGNERWTLALEWSGQGAFVADPLREWTVDGRRAGKTRSARGFTFATLDAGGHMVRDAYKMYLRFLKPGPQSPYDKPKESLEMINRWLAGQPL